LSGRNSIGYEINKDFLSVIKTRLEDSEPSLFPKNIQYKIQKNIETDWQKEIDTSPYIFSDPVKFDKKIDPNKLKFGSKINIDDGKNGIKREEYYTVKEILDTNLIKLNNDIIIRLLGVKRKNNTVSEAIDFLENKIGKGRVFLKFDSEKYDSKNHLLSYVYMKNKTFINAHLLKHGFADIDMEIPFKYLRKFQGVVKEQKEGAHEN